MESQGKSGNLKIFAQKVKESQGKKFQWKMKFLEAHLVLKIVLHKNSYWVCLFYCLFVVSAIMSLIIYHEFCVLYTVYSRVELG